MKTRLLTTTGLTLLTLSLLGCTPSEEPETPSPSPSASETTTPTETPNPTSSATPTETSTTTPIIVDLSQVPTTFEGAGSFTPEDISAAVTASTAFTQQALTSPAWYSGSWKQNDWATNVEPYLGALTEPMRNTLGAYNWDEVTQRATIASFFPVFEPTEALTVNEECATTWEACVRENIVFSQVSAVEEIGRLKVSYVVTTSRALLQGETPAQSKLEYTVNHWMTKTPEGVWLIDATNNSTVFGQVTKAVV